MHIKPQIIHFIVVIHCVLAGPLLPLLPRRSETSLHILFFLISSSHLLSSLLLSLFGCRNEKMICLIHLE